MIDFDTIEKSYDAEYWARKDESLSDEILEEFKEEPEPKEFLQEE